MTKTPRVWVLVSLAMWVIYGQLTGRGYWIGAGMVGTVIASVMVAADYRRGAAKLMDSTSLGYFLLEMLIVIFAGRDFMQRYHLPIVWGVFAIVAAITLFTGSPFTMQHTREQTPPGAWDGATFYRMNLHLTLAWTLIFTLGALLGAVTLVAGHLLMLGLVIPSAAMLLGFIFGSRYPKRFAAAFEVESRLMHTDSNEIRLDVAGP